MRALRLRPMRAAPPRRTTERATSATTRPFRRRPVRRDGPRASAPRVAAGEVREAWRAGAIPKSIPVMTVTATATRSTAGLTWTASSLGTEKAWGIRVERTSTPRYAIPTPRPAPSTAMTRLSVRSLPASDFPVAPMDVRMAISF